MKGFSTTNVKRMRIYASEYPDFEIGAQPVHQLSWGVIIDLNHRIKEKNIRDWYAQQALKEGWSRNVLNLMIKSDLYGSQAEAMKVATQPLTLYLTGNNIGAEGAQYIAEAMKVAKVPLTLDLSANDIRDAGAEHLANAIKEATQPLTLDLGANNIGAEGAEHLANAIKEATQPLTLHLGGNDIGIDGIQSFKDALQSRKVPFKTRIVGLGQDIDDLCIKNDLYHQSTAHQISTQLLLPSLGSVSIEEESPFAFLPIDVIGEILTHYMLNASITMKDDVTRYAPRTVIAQNLQRLSLDQHPEQKAL